MFLMFYKFISFVACCENALVFFEIDDDFQSQMEYVKKMGDIKYVGSVLIFATFF